VLNSLSDEFASNTPNIALRLRPTLGRTVDGLFGDPTRGFRQLERKCNENNVRGDMRSQEKHVRRGQRRKNLRILRWRRMFMEGFKSELNRVHRMRKQGW
jgi:small subunit ribosomal protein MRP21